MPKPQDIVPVAVKGAMPTSNGCAIFLGNDDKTFVIYVDHAVGHAIRMTLDAVKRERPMTHDLIGHIFTGFGIGVDHVLINDANEGTFYARLLLKMENELGRKLVELDARPSDSIVIALQHDRPIHVARAVFDSVEDMSEILERVLEQQAENASDQTDLDELASDEDDDAFDDDDQDDEDEDGNKGK